MEDLHFLKMASLLAFSRTTMDCSRLFLTTVLHVQTIFLFTPLSFSFLEKKKEIKLVKRILYMCGSHRDLRLVMRH